MSTNNIVVFEERADGTFRAFYRDMDCYCEGQYGSGGEPVIFCATTMRDCIEGYDEWCSGIDTDGIPFTVEYGYVFELRADTEQDPS